MPAIAIVGMLGGFAPSLLAAGVAVAFVAYASAQRGPLFQAPWDRLDRLIVMSISAPLLAFVVGSLYRRGEKTVQTQLSSERAHAALRAAEF